PPRVGRAADVRRKGLMTDTTITRRLQGCLGRLHQGDATARDEMIEVAFVRLTVLTRKMLHRFGRLRDFEQTEDIAQAAKRRLWEALGQVRPGSVVEFFRLAATQIRRELIDLCRHYYGPEGAGSNLTLVGVELPEPDPSGGPA